MATAPSSWSQLPIDILVSIFCKLPIREILRCTVVCAHWSDAVRSLRSSSRLELPPQFPWLLFSGERSHNDLSVAHFYHHLEKASYALPLPDPPIHRRLCLGSAHGWLITADHRSMLQLLNPLTGEHVDLPHLPDHIKCVYNLHGELRRFELDCPGEDFPRYVHPNDLRSQFFKATLSSNPSQGSYTVVLIHGNLFKLSFTKAGDEKWTTLDAIMHCDAAFMDGTLYAATRTGEVQAWDLSAPDPTPRLILPAAEATRSHRYYLARTPSGELLHVRTDFQFSFLDCLGHRRIIKVYRVDVERGCSIEVGDLGGCTLFLGSNQSICLSSALFPGLEPDSVYITEDDRCQKKQKEDEQVRKLLAYRLVDDKCWSIRLPDLNRSLLIWITPNICNTDL
ncbi:putative F-box protein At5g55150 [Curcuma longa]|uniref:putative F-box protein At5g55150 n=1 Tax=Curcuma longa TaxID=136217 RepID=UPI003D9FAEBB